MTSIIHNTPLSRFKYGFFSPFRAFRFIREHPRLYKYILIPFAINLSVFSLTIYYGLGFFFHTVTQYIPQGDAWYWVMLNYLLLALAVIITLVLTFFTFTVVGSLIASPFNDILSERTEEILTGKSSDEPFTLKFFIEDSWRILVIESKKIGLFLLGMLLLLCLNILPVIGSLLYSVLSILWTLFFLVMEYTGYVFSRKRHTLAEQRHTLTANFAVMFGFGVGIFCILAIPFFHFLCIPLGVVGATHLLYDAGVMTPFPPAEKD